MQSQTREQLAQRDQELWERFNSGDSNALGEIVSNMEGIINKNVGKFSFKQRIPPSALFSEGEQIVADAVRRYNPQPFLDKGKKPMALGSWVNQHLSWRMKDFSAAHGQLGKIQRSRYHKLTDFAYEKGNLESELGREPSAAEVADKMGLPVAEIERIERDSASNLIASGSSFENISQGSPRKKLALEMAYYDLNDEQRSFMEYYYGMYGKPQISSTGKIARKLGWSGPKASKVKNVVEAKVGQYT